MHRARLVAAVAVTFVLTSVAAAIAADQFIDGNLDVTGRVKAAAVSTEDVSITGPLAYHGGETIAIGTLGFAPGNDRIETLAGEWPEGENGQETFMVTQMIGGPRNVAISTKHQPNRGSFLVRLSKPAPAGGVRFVYQIVVLTAP